MKGCLKSGVYKNIPLLIVCIPCRVQVRGLRIWGGRRQGWVNESFLTILEVILNKATLMWEVERNLMVPVCFGSLCPEDAHIQRMTESHFSRPRLTCISITPRELQMQATQACPQPMNKHPSASRDIVPKLPFIH